MVGMKIKKKFLPIMVKPLDKQKKTWYNQTNWSEYSCCSCLKTPTLRQEVRKSSDDVAD